MMAQFSLSSLTKELTEVEEPGLTFAGGSLKWTTAEDVKEVTSAIDAAKNLTYLKLEGNTLGVEAAAAIGKSLEKHPEFKKALWKDMFTGRLKNEIPVALEHLGNGLMLASAQLTVLDCSDNALGPNGMVGLQALLSSRVCFSLKELHLNNCGLGIYGGKMLSESILDCYKNSCDAGTPLDLRVFVTGRNRLENEGAKSIAKIFCTINTLEEIAMPQNSIFHVGISALCEGFKNNPNMKVLNLNDNIMTPKGAAAIADAIQTMPLLREINLGDCLLKTKGALYLADVLADNQPDLEVLNLEANEIGSEGGLQLIAALHNKPKLKTLNLDTNKFGYDCIDEIKETMAKICPSCVVGSFDDDEGDSDVDDEDDEDGDEDDDGEEEEEENEDGDHHNDTTEDADEENDIYGEEYGNDSAAVDNYVTAVFNKSNDDTAEGSFLSNTSVTYEGETPRPNTVETFCNTPNPSLKMFESIEDTNKLEAFRDYLKGFKCDNYLIMLTFTALKCAALSKVSQEALDISVALYADSFAYAQEVDQVTRVMNFFLIQLGLLKSEQKEFKPAYNLKGCRYAFRETLKQKELPIEVKQTFTLFLDRFDD
ncbi:ran GTPase-activating protein [Episyrphus balteatus]|uniref:ran GTPase-activating protein n=1 Tax=Episyrphus balteatus TaxID=286459 RepID=UPI00248558FC|nr:ran GTPase-activating protein [Episyrphus balteatus]